MIRCRYIPLAAIFFFIAVNRTAFADSRLQDLTYYPKADRHELAIRDGISIEQNSSSTTGSSTKRNQAKASINYQYGLTDLLRLEVNESLLWSEDAVLTSSAGTETDNVSFGLSNPTLVLGARWTFANASAMDVALSAAPSFGPKQNPNGSKALVGNNLSGGAFEEVGAVYYSRPGLNEYSLGALIVHEEPATTETASGESKGGDDWVPSLTLTDRFHLAPDHFLQGSLSYTFRNDHRTDSAQDLATKIVDLPTSTETIEYGYALSNNAVMEIALAYSFSKTESVSSTSQSTSANETLTATAGFVTTF